MYKDNDEFGWYIDSDCSAIHVVSTHFDTHQGYDFQSDQPYNDELTIAGREFSGSAVIDLIIDESSFVATFKANEWGTATGFTVLWSCFDGPIERQNGIKSYNISHWRENVSDRTQA